MPRGLQGWAGRNQGGMQLQIPGIRTSIMEGMMRTRAELLPLGPSSAPQTQRGIASEKSPAALFLGSYKESFKFQLECQPWASEVALYTRCNEGSQVVL